VGGRYGSKSHCATSPTNEEAGKQSGNCGEKFAYLTASLEIVARVPQISLAMLRLLLHIDLHPSVCVDGRDVFNKLCVIGPIVSNLVALYKLVVEEFGCFATSVIARNQG